MNIERLVNDARPKLMGYALRHFTRSTDEAEDLVATTILRAIKGFDGWDERASFSSWATRILTNAYLDSRKGRSRQWKDLSHIDDLLFDPVDGFDLAADVIERDRLFRALDALKEKLGEDRFQTLIIGVTDTYEAAAQEVGLPVGTVKSRINRARIWLAEWEKRSDTGQATPLPPPKADRVTPDWAEVRARWEAGARISDLMAEFNISKGPIYAHKKAEGWVRNVAPPGKRCMFNWGVIRADYETGRLTIPQIAQHYGVSEAHAYNRKKKDGWTKNQANLPEVLCA